MFLEEREEKMGKSKKESKFDDCLYFTISRLFRIANKYAEDAFSELEICPTHGYLMILLDEQREGLSVSEIADKLAIAPSTVTRFVDKLVDKGLVEREKEGKKSYTRITKKGIEEMGIIFEACQRINNKIIRKINNLTYLKSICKDMSQLADYLEEGEKFEIDFSI